jgi:predicted RNA-binding protein
MDMGDGEEELLMESVDRTVPGADGVYMENIFSEARRVRARIKEMALVSHRVVLEKLP